MQIETLVPAGSPEVSFKLEGRGLKGGGRINTATSLQDTNSYNSDHLFYSLYVLTFTGRFGQSTPPLVEFLKDILRRYPEGGQILKVSVLLYHFGEFSYERLCRLAAAILPYMVTVVSPRAKPPNLLMLIMYFHYKGPAFCADMLVSFYFEGVDSKC